MDGPPVDWMKRLAGGHSGARAGSAVIVDGGRRFNRLLFVRPDGSVGHYDKRHLFAFGGEDERYADGSRRVNVEYLGWRINLQI